MFGKSDRKAGPKYGSVTWTNSIGSSEPEAKIKLYAIPLVTMHNSAVCSASNVNVTGDPIAKLSCVDTTQSRAETFSCAWSTRALAVQFEFFYLLPAVLLEMMKWFQVYNQSRTSFQTCRISSIDICVQNRNVLRSIHPVRHLTFPEVSRVKIGQCPPPLVSFLVITAVLETILGPSFLYIA